MFYYTEEYTNHVSVDKMDEHVGHLIYILNEAFENSKIPVKAKQFCRAMPSYLHDKEAWEIHRYFRLMMGGSDLESVTRLRNTADVTILLAVNACFSNGTCRAGGGADIGSVETGATAGFITFVRKFSENNITHCCI